MPHYIDSKSIKKAIIKQWTLQASTFVLSFLCVILPLNSHANPVMSNIGGGQISIQQGPNATTIHQTSQSGIINWQSFNIKKGEITQFIQPIGGITLNRISPLQGASQIYGTLTATGKIILVNPAGLYFGPSSYVNVGGLIATTRDISDTDFLSNHYQFSPVNGYNGSVVNEGQIIAQNHGLVALVGANVTNTGLIQAELGHAVLASGDSFTVTFPDHGLFNFAINHPTSQANGRVGVTNRGTIRADGGQVLITAQAAQGVLDQAINTSGVIEARSFGMQNGNIILSGGNGVVKIAGNVNASGRHINQTGGTINVTGHDILVDTGTVIDASGALGGGNINIGGNLHGEGPLPNANTTTFQPGAEILADALEQGDGGQIVLWSDAFTGAYGSISAQGGLLGGNGGSVETSSHHVLDIKGLTVNLKAAHGQLGNWLLDPSDVHIIYYPTQGGTLDYVNSGYVFNPTDDISYISAYDISNNLYSSNVTIQTGSSGNGNGDIVVEVPIYWPTYYNVIYNTSLTLSAYRDIIFNPGASIVSYNYTPPTINLIANNAGAFDSASGHGTVLLAPNSFSGPNMAINIYYTPGSLLNPTDFSPSHTDYDPYYGTGINAYMYVSNLTDLQTIDQTPALWSSKFALQHDLNAASLLNFTPIGDSTTNFTGIFDGQFHTINNLTINLPNSTNVGMFGVLYGQVINLGLINVNVTGSNNVGGLVGFNHRGYLRNDYVTGTVSGGNNSTNIGGLVGLNYQTSLDNFSYNTSTIYNSFSSASVHAGNNSMNIGGLVGNNYVEDPIAASLVPQAVIGYSYSTGNVTAGTNSTNIGGFVGLNEDDTQNSGVSAFIEDSFSTGYVSAGAGSTHIGGFVGNLLLPAYKNNDYYLSSTMINNYYDTETSGQATNAYINGLTHQQMTHLANLPGLPTSYFSIIDGISYPYLTVDYPTPPVVISGTLSNTNPYTGHTYDVRNQPIAVSINGALVDSIYTGANGYYYFLEKNGTVAGNAPISISATGAVPVDYLTVTPASGQLTGIEMIPYTFTVSSPAGVDWTLTSTGDTQALNSNTVTAIATLGGQGNITIADNFTWASDMLLILSADNNIIIDAGASLTNTSSSNAGLYAFANKNFAYALGQGGNFINHGTLNFLGNITIYSNPSDATYTDVYHNQGSGNLIDYMYINNLNNLQYISNHTNLWDRNFALSNDIDASSISNFNPIGNSNQAYTGNFDGLNHIISYLTIHQPNMDDLGLFGVSTGNIDNLGVTQVLITGNNNIGGLVGLKIGGELSNVFSTGTLIASANSTNIGGLIGENNGASISDAYTNSIILAPQSTNVGGLIGNNSGDITRTYSASYLQGAAHLGGLIGNNTGNINDSFWDTAYSGLANGVGSDSGTSQIMGGCYGSAACAGNGSIDLTQSANLSADPFDWDFRTTWNVINGQTYPFLRQFYTNNPSFFTGELQTTNPLTGINYGNPAGQPINLMSNGNVVKTFFPGANGFFYSLDKYPLLSDQSLFLLYTVNGPIKANTVGRSVEGFNANIPLIANTFTVAGNANGEAVSSSPYLFGTGVNYNSLTNADLAAVLANVGSNDILYAMTGNDVTVKDGYDFMIDHDVLFNLKGNISTSNGSIILGGVTSSPGGPSAFIMDTLDPSYQNQVTLQTKNSGDIINNGVMLWTGGQANSITLNLNAANNIVLNGIINALPSGNLTLSAAYQDRSITTSDTAQVQVNKFNLLKGKWYQNGLYTLMTFVDQNGDLVYYSSDTTKFFANDFQINSGNMESGQTEFLRAAGGTGTPDDPYVLTDWYGLQGIGSSDRLLASSWELSIPIGYEGYIAPNILAFWNNGHGFVPIGSASHPFTGTFTGNANGKVIDFFDSEFAGISELYSQWADRSYVGLFGYTGPSAVISDLLLQVNGVQGNNYVGSLVGENHGTIRNVYVIPYTVGNNGVGGIAGINAGTISDAAVIGGYVGGKTGVGGIAGGNSGVINRALVASYITGNTAYGKVGGLAGYNTNLISNSFWDTDYTGLSNATNFASSKLVNVAGGCFTGHCAFGGTVNLSSIQPYLNAGWDIQPVGYQTIYTSEPIYGNRPVLTMDTLTNLFGSYFISYFFPPDFDFSSSPAIYSYLTNYFGQSFIDYYFPGQILGYQQVPTGITMNSISSPHGWSILPNNGSYPFLNAMYYMKNIGPTQDQIQVFAGNVEPRTPGLIEATFYGSATYLPPSITGANGFYYTITPPYYLEYSNQVLASIISQNAVGSVYVPIDDVHLPYGTNNIPLPITKTDQPFFNPISHIQLLYAAVGEIVPATTSNIAVDVFNELQTLFYHYGYNFDYGTNGIFGSNTRNYTPYYFDAYNNTLYTVDLKDDLLNYHQVNLKTILTDIIKSQAKLDTHTLLQPIYPNCNHY